MGAVDDFLTTLGQAPRDAYQRLCDLAVQLVPDARQAVSYGMPALTYRDKPLLGFRVAAKHLSFFPFSGTIAEEFSDRLPDLPRSKGTIRFTVDLPVEDDVVLAIVQARMAEIDAALT